MNNGEVAADGNPDDILSDDILPKYGLREPLYIEALKRVGVQISGGQNISNIANSIAYKDEVLKRYKSSSGYIKVQERKMFNHRNLSFRYLRIHLMCCRIYL